MCPRPGRGWTCTHCHTCAGALFGAALVLVLPNAVRLATPAALRPLLRGGLCDGAPAPVRPTAPLFCSFGFGLSVAPAADRSIECLSGPRQRRMRGGGRGRDDWRCRACADPRTARGCTASATEGGAGGGDGDGGASGWPLAHRQRQMHPLLPDGGVMGALVKGRGRELTRQQQCAAGGRLSLGISSCPVPLSDIRGRGTGN